MEMRSGQAITAFYYRGATAGEVQISGESSRQYHSPSLDSHLWARCHITGFPRHTARAAVLPPDRFANGFAKSTHAKMAQPGRSAELRVCGTRAFGKLPPGEGQKSPEQNPWTRGGLAGLCSPASPPLPLPRRASGTTRQPHPLLSLWDTSKTPLLAGAEPALGAGMTR